jgi:CRP-like cAMP-binding protein
MQGPVFSGLQSAELAVLLRAGTPRSMASGEVLLKEGELGDSMFFLLKGKVEVLRGDVHIAIREAGEVFGEMALLDPAPRSATVVASGKVDVIELERGVFQRMVKRGDDVAIKVLQTFMKTMCHRLEHMNSLVRDEVTGQRQAQGGVLRRIWGKLTGWK